MHRPTHRPTIVTVLAVLVTLAGFAACAPATLAAATLYPLDDEPVQGSLSWADQAVRIDDRRWDLADCMALMLQDRTQLQETEQLGIWLVDGGWLPCRRIRAGEREHHLAIESQLGTFELPLTAVSGWGTTLPEALGDDDVLIMNGEPFPVRILGCRDGGIAFRSDLSDDTLVRQFGEINAARLRVEPQTIRGVHLRWRSHVAHPPLLLRATDQGPALAVAPDAIVNDEALIGRLEVGGGRLVPLAELPPSKVVEEGAFDVVWHYTVGTNLDGSPLFLDGIRRERGLVIHSKATLAWNLHGDFERFQAQIGIADIVADVGDCAVTIRGDDAVLWEISHLTGATGTHLDLDVTDVETLRIEVGYGSRYDIGDHVVLADAALIKRATD